MTVDAVIFDLFDTLVDLTLEDLPSFEVGGRTRRGTGLRLHRAVAGHSDVGLEDFLAALAGVDRELREPAYAAGRELRCIERFQALVDRLGIDDGELAGELTRIHMGALRAQARILPHHPGVLAGLRRYVRLGLCSNFNHSPTARRVLDDAGLAGHLDAVVISEDVGLRKPRPEVFRAALTQLGVDASEALHVGDRLDADVDGAAAAGIRTAWISRRWPDPDQRLARHEGAVPDFVVRDLAELEPIVRDAAGTA